MSADTAGKGGKPHGRGTGPRQVRPHDPAKPQGLARWLAKAGYGTRAATSRMVSVGRVSVDGEIVLDPSTPVGLEAIILVDGKPADENHRTYLAFHKPTRVVTAPGDRGGRRQVFDLLPAGIPGLRPAGRMDAATSGLLLISNDPGWNEIAAVAPGLEKEFRVRVSGRIGDLELGVIGAGMQLPGLGHLRPEAVELLVQEEEQTTLRFVTIAGKVRQIRRVFRILRHEVLELSRTRLGPIQLGELPVGRWRLLEPLEVAAIRAAARTQERSLKGGPPRTSA